MYQSMAERANTGVGLLPHSGTPRVPQAVQVNIMGRDGSVGHPMLISTLSGRVRAPSQSAARVTMTQSASTGSGTKGSPVSLTL